MDNLHQSLRIPVPLLKEEFNREKYSCSRHQQLDRQDIADESPIPFVPVTTKKDFRWSISTVYTHNNKLLTYNEMSKILQPFII